MQEPRTWLSFISDSRVRIPSIWRPRSARYVALTGDSEIAQDDRHGEKQAKSHEHYTSTIISNDRPRRTLVAYIISALSLLWYLLPRRGRPLRAKAFHELHPMSYLDALRGYLAIIIYTGHTMSKRWRWIPQPVLAVPWLQFPVRGGHTSLDIFFWISGYAITYKMVGFMHAKRQDKVFETLSSAIFRRYLRLFLPVVFTTFATIVALETGVAILPPHKKGMLDGNPFVFWLKDTSHAVNPFTHVTSWWTKEERAGSELLDQFWSINTEFRSSMILFGFCAATSKMTPSRRKMILLLCIPVFICWQVQWAAMAFLGMWFAECRQERTRARAAERSLVTVEIPQTEKSTITTTTTNLTPSSFEQIASEKHDLSAGPKSPFATTTTFRFLPAWARSAPSPNKWTIRSTSASGSKTLSKIRQPLLIAIFLYSFVLLKDPQLVYAGEMRFPHNLIALAVPSHWHLEMKMHFHLIIGAIMMLYPLDHLPILQRPLLTPFSQYLGELSFGIYAVHLTVRWIVWEPRYLKWASNKYGHKDFDYFHILFPGYIIMTLTVLWMADLFRRVDTLVVKFCRDLEAWLFE